MEQIVDESSLNVKATCFKKGVKSHVFHTEFTKRQGWYYDAIPFTGLSQGQENVSDFGVLSDIGVEGEGINVGDGLGLSVKGSAEYGQFSEISVDDRVDPMCQREQVSDVDRVDPLEMCQKNVVL